jgi:hypothetical protein
MVHETSCRWLLSALKGDLDPASYVEMPAHHVPAGKRLFTQLGIRENR